MAPARARPVFPSAGASGYHFAMLRDHDIEIRVRYQETDGQGRLHHANYFTYFEMGRTELLRASGIAYRQIEEEGRLLVVSEISCKYLQPANYDDVLRLRTSIVQTRAASVIHEYQIFRGDTLLAKGRSVLACIDREGRLQRLPDALLEGDAAPG
jgi:acyl-CoA thioester hydrolase